MALCTLTFPAHVGRVAAKEHDGSRFLSGTDLVFRFQKRVNQVKKRPGGICASLSETGEYPSQRPPTPILDTINYPIHMKNLSIKVKTKNPNHKHKIKLSTFFLKRKEFLKLIELCDSSLIWY